MAFAVVLTVSGTIQAQEPNADFLRYCATCHGVDARGVEGLGVNLAASSYVASSSADQLAEFLKIGRLPNDPASVSQLPMPGFAHLDPATLMAIADYVKLLNEP